MNEQPSLTSVEPTRAERRSDAAFEVEVHHSPPWRRAVVELIDSGKFGFGDVIPHEVLTAAFGMLELPAMVRRVVAKQWDLRRMQQIQALEEYLLEERQMCLRSVPSLGYQIILPSEQTDFALEKGRRELRKVVRDMTRRLHHVAHDRLTDEQSRQNTDALGRLAYLKSSMQTARRRLFER